LAGTAGIVVFNLTSLAGVVGSIDNTVELTKPASWLKGIALACIENPHIRTAIPTIINAFCKNFAFIFFLLMELKFWLLFMPFLLL
jgi:hypothetical protein